MMTNDKPQWRSSDTFCILCVYNEFNVVTLLSLCCTDCTRCARASVGRVCLLPSIICLCTIIQMSLLQNNIKSLHYILYIQSHVKNDYQ